MPGDNLNLNPPFLTEGNQAVRVFNPLTRDISVVSKLERGRWYPSVMTLSDGNLLILGGMQQVRRLPVLEKACQKIFCKIVLCS